MKVEARFSFKHQKPAAPLKCLIYSFLQHLHMVLNSASISTAIQCTSPCTLPTLYTLHNLNYINLGDLHLVYPTTKHKNYC